MAYEKLKTESIFLEYLGCLSSYWQLRFWRECVGGQLQLPVSP